MGDAEGEGVSVDDADADIVKDSNGVLVPVVDEEDEVEGEYVEVAEVVEHALCEEEAVEE